MVPNDRDVATARGVRSNDQKDITKPVDGTIHFNFSIGY
jgi:hypothetical protein